MKDVVIYGAGGFGREIACLLCAINKKKQVWNFVGFIDDAKSVGDENEYGRVLGGMDYLNAYSRQLNVIIAIGNPHGVASIVSGIYNDNIIFPNIYAPNLRFADSKNMQIGKGNIFSWDCHISCHVTIGDFNAFNGDVIVGHDAVIGNYNSFMPGVRVSGETTIGNENYFGVSSIVLQKKKVGNNTMVGAGSVIIRSTKDNSTYMGNPAALIKY